MDYSTRDLIRELIWKLESIAEALRRLSEPKHIGEDKSANDASRKPDIQTDNANPNVLPASSVPTPPPTKTHCEITCKIEKNWWDDYKPFVELAGVFILGVYTLYTIKMYCANKEAANAAKQSADVAQTTLVASNRPWVTAQLALNSPLVFDKDGASMSVVLTMKNVGHSPAVRLRPNIQWFPVFLEHPDPPGKLMEVCKEVNSNSSIPISPESIAKGTHLFSQTIFPNDVAQQTVTLHMNQADIEEGVSGIAKSMGFPGGFANERRALQIDVVACIGYHASFVETQYHTGVITELFRYDPAQPKAAIEIEANPGTVPVDRLKLSIDPIFGTYTDPDTPPTDK